ncbi:MAG: LysM peptidoglycan-binding domain-containing protein [Thermoleophilia bacterium]|nr:LysM peptidoglycan-binding domain-containing protein [Thermoleophilia bacterium]
MRSLATGAAVLAALASYGVGVDAGAQSTSGAAAGQTGGATGTGLYTVRPGDTLYSIANRFGTTVADLTARNALVNAGQIRAGQILIVPALPDVTEPRFDPQSGAVAMNYTVVSGDTLNSIARRFGTSASNLALANGIANPNAVRSGTRLSIPGRTTGVRTVSAVVVTGTPATAYHTVRSGETLGSIARRYTVPIGALISANGIRNPDLLTIGSRLSVPSSRSTTATVASVAVPVASPSSSAGVHRVASGETLGSIAARYGTTVARIQSLNGISDPNLVVQGAALKVPGATGSSATGSTYIGPRTVSSSEVVAMINSAAARYGVDPSLARAIAFQESGFNHNVRSNVGAIGAMQLMPETAQWVGPLLVGRTLNPYSLRDNIDGGVAYLAWLHRRTGSSRLSAAGYYQGYNRLRERGMYEDTKAYVASVMGHYGKV